MPWKSGAVFAARHNQKLRGEAARKARDVAQAMVARGAPEGEAIATGNKAGNRLMRAYRHPSSKKQRGDG